MSDPAEQHMKTPIHVEAGGVSYFGHYETDERMVRVEYGSARKATQLGGMSRTPHVLARLLLAEMVREQQGTVRGI